MREIKKKPNGFTSFVILAIYDDDEVSVSNDVVMLDAEKESLCREFEIVHQTEIEKFTLFSVPFINPE